MVGTSISPNAALNTPPPVTTILPSKKKDLVIES